MFVKLILVILCSIIFYTCIDAFEKNDIDRKLYETTAVICTKTSRRLRALRSSRPVTFEIDEKPFDFNLKPLDRDIFAQDLPVYNVKSVPGKNPNYTYELVEGTERILSNGRFFVDNVRKAVFFGHSDERSGETLYDGLFGQSRNKRVIKSLPESQRTKLQGINIAGNRIEHGVRKDSEKYEFLSTFRRDQSINPLETKLEKPLNILFPKILAVVDYHLYRSLGSDITNTLRYVTTFFTAVDQEFIDLETPKIQVLLKGIIVVNDEKALNFIHQSQGTGDYADYLDVVEVLNNMRLYFRHHFRNDVEFQNYDAAILLTGQKTMIGGLTYGGKICSIWYNDAVVTDDASYRGVATAAHELAHMLNVQHDTTEPDSKCFPHSNDGGTSIMFPSKLDSTEYIFWSKCSKDSMKEFSSLKASECLASRNRVRDYDEDEWF